MFENTKAILHSIVEGKPPRKGTKMYAKIDDALFEIFTAKEKIEEQIGAISRLLLEARDNEKKIKVLEEELAELKERAAQGAISDLHGYAGGEYNV